MFYKIYKFSISPLFSLISGILQKSFPGNNSSPNSLSTVSYTHNSGGSFVACKTGEWFVAN